MVNMRTFDWDFRTTLQFQEFQDCWDRWKCKRKAETLNWKIVFICLFTTRTERWNLSKKRWCQTDLHPCSSPSPAAPAAASRWEAVLFVSSRRRPARAADRRVRSTPPPWTPADFHATTTTHILTNCCKVNGRLSIALNGNPSQSYRASPAIWDHTVLPATWHGWPHPP